MIRIRAAGLAACCNYFLKEKKKVMIEAILLSNI